MKDGRLTLRDGRTRFRVWAPRRKAFQGSVCNPASRRGTVFTLKDAGFMRPPSSSQCSGVETGAPLRARTEYAATVVAPSALRR